MLKAMLFDLGQVIVPFDFSRGYQAIAALCSKQPDEIPACIRATGLVPRFEEGSIEAADFVTQLAAALGADLDYDQFNISWNAIFMEHTYIPESMLEGLRRRYRTVLLSNTNSLHFEQLRQKLPHMRHFDSFVLSYQVKAMKPSPAIYAAAVAAAGCEPEECFFTDDLEVNVAAAREFGMDAVRFESLEQIQGELRARGVRWD
jgi:epoxide hydrolase-like predicted phosphatase